MSIIEVNVRDTKRQLSKLKNSVGHIDHTLQRCKSDAAKRERSTLLGAVQANHEKLHANYVSQQDQQKWATRLLFDLRNTHEALEEDHAVKSMAMKYTHKCLLVTPQPDEDPRAVEARKQMSLRALRTETSFVELRAGTLRELRRRLKAMATLDDGSLDSFFAKIISSKSGEELTDYDVKVVLRKVLKIGTNIISDCEIATLCAMLDEDDSGGIGIQEFRDFIEQEPTMKTVDSFTIEHVAKAREKRATEEHEVRPPLETLPVLKPTQIANIKKRIRGAAWIAATDQGLKTGSGLELGALFSQYDKDGGGDLEDMEVRKAIRTGLKIPKSQLSDSELWTLIHFIDQDHTGSIDVQEFVDWVNSD